MIRRERVGGDDSGTWEQSALGGLQTWKRSVITMGVHHGGPESAHIERLLRALGHGYKEVGKPGSGVFRSSDGARQFRMTAADITGEHGVIGPRVHFEALDPATGRVIENNHVPIVSK